MITPRRNLVLGSAMLTALTLGAPPAGAVDGAEPPADGVPSLAQPAAVARTTAQIVENQLELRDAMSSQPIINPRGLPIVDGLDPAVQSSVKLVERPDGADLIIDFKNTAQAAKPLGMITVGVITPGGTAVTYTDLRKASDLVPADANTFAGKAWNYPGEFYSPSMVLMGQQSTVGVSLLYPMLEYQHDVRVGVFSPPGPLAAGAGGRGWAVRFQFSTPKQNLIKYEARLRPGEHRTYTVAVRVAKARDQWMRTLLPYRSYFRDRYEGVQYQRHTAPVLALPLAEDALIADDNPMGWTQWRPDIWGFGKLTRALRTTYGGWSTVMLMNPSGLYKTHRELNPPFQFASAWADHPMLASAVDERTGLPAVTATGKNIGLWWGNAARVVSEWDNGGGADLDPENAEHIRAALVELDSAFMSGATVIGLGNFSHDRVPVWRQYQWVNDLLARYPGAKFVIDPNVCDVMHTVAASMVAGYNDTQRPPKEADLYAITHPNYLADFLNPGHETWGTFRYNGLRQYFVTEPTDERILNDMQAFANYGYVPCFFVTQNIDASMSAAESWKSTVPADLQLADLNRRGGIAGQASIKPNSAPGTAHAVPDTPTPPKRLKGVTVRPATAQELADSSGPGAEIPVQEALRKVREMSAKAAQKQIKAKRIRVTTSDESK